MAETVHQEPTTPAAEGQQNNERTFTQAEMNAIISAARSECIGGTIYLAGRDVATGELIPDLLPCPMCRRMIINAGLSKIVIRRTPSTYDILNVQDWVFHDDSVIDPSESGEQA